MDLRCIALKNHMVLIHLEESLYSLIGDFFIIWRLLKTCFDYDIDDYYIQNYTYSSYMNM